MTENRARDPPQTTRSDAAGPRRRARASRDRRRSASPPTPPNPASSTAVEAAAGAVRPRRRTGARGRPASSPALTATTKRAAPVAALEGDRGPSARRRPAAARRAAPARLARRRSSARTDVAQPGVPAALVPREAAAVRRIVAAAQPDLVAVVDARRARERHLEQRRQPDARDVAAQRRSAAAACRASRARLSWTATTSGS